MPAVSKEDIQNAIISVTGAPSSGLICEITPAIVDAVNRLVNGDDSAKQTRVVQAAETRKVDTEGK
jgi:hypothetical protein